VTQAADQPSATLRRALTLPLSTAVKLSLIALKWRSSGPVGGPVCGGGDHTSVPLIVPVLGVITSLARLAMSVP
jgi:hypothetical protein